MLSVETARQWSKCPHGERHDHGAARAAGERIEIGAPLIEFAPDAAPRSGSARHAGGRRDDSGTVVGTCRPGRR